MAGNEKHKSNMREILSNIDQCVIDLIENGVASIPNNHEYILTLQRLRENALDFFQDASTYKRLHQFQNSSKGYRGPHEEYSQHPERPDQNESFSYWKSTQSDLRNRGLSPKFMNDAEKFIHMSELYANAILVAFSKYYNYNEKELEFRNYSYLQINYTPASLESDYIQDKHEDGHFLTLHNGNGKGLILHQKEGDIIDFESSLERTTLLPGSTISLMTGGQIPPMYHEVKNPFDGRIRISVMYFMNLAPTQFILPFICNSHNDGVDIADHVDRFPMNFGLPPLKQS